MRKKGSNIDGFVPRRRVSLADSSASKKSKNVKSDIDQFLASTDNLELGKTSPERQLSQYNISSDIDDSLQNIDDFSSTDDEKSLSKKQRRRMKVKKPKSKKRKIIKWIAIIVVLIILGIAGFLAYKLITASNSALQGNIFNIFSNKPLKEDENGRSNFLILGTSEDDPGHDGGDLTDSMMIISVDQDEKNAYMISIPRDLYVEYGETCYSGNAGKINAYFSCANTGTSDADEQDRLAKTQKLVGNIFGIDIQYGAHINQTVIKELVDAIDGIDVDIQGSNGAPGILDRNFDWRCNYTCYLVKYDNGVHHLDGTHALYLAQARGDTAPTYGLSRSNFDREVNQQKIIKAVKEKMASSGTLTNITKVSSIIDAFGNNLRTNVGTDEVRTIMDILNNMDSNEIRSIDLYDSENRMVKTGSVGGASVVLPSAGLYNYSEIQTYVKKYLTSDAATREAAPIAIFNGSGISGFGSTKANDLEGEGFTISSVDTAPTGNYEAVEIYKIGEGYEATATKLKNIYSVEIKTSTPPVTVSDDVRFVIIFGANTTV